MENFWSQWGILFIGVGALAMALWAILRNLTIIPADRPPISISWRIQPPAIEVIVANTTNNSLTGHALDKSTCQLTATPTIRIIGNATEISNPVGVAFDNRTIYLSCHGLPGQAGVVNRYDENISGNASPSRRINGPQSLLSEPNGLVVRPGNPRTLLVANEVVPPDPNNLPAILEYTLSSGSDAPTGRIQGPATTIQAPADVALDAAQNVFVVEPNTNRILIFLQQKNTIYAQAPTRVIDNPGGAQLDRPIGLAFDRWNGDLYVLNIGNNSINVYADGASASQVPVRQIVGANTTLNNPSGIDIRSSLDPLDSCRRIFIAQANGILVFSTSDNGDAIPVVITDQALSGPRAIAVR